MSVSAKLLAQYTVRSIQRPDQAPQFASKQTPLFLFDAENPPCTDATMLARDTPTGTGGFPSSTSPQGVQREGALNTAGSASVTAAHSASGGSTRPSTTAIPSTSGSSSTQPSSLLPTPPNDTSISQPPSSSPGPITPLATIRAGGSYHVTHLARLPNDDTIRPSTLEGTNTPISVKHQLVIEIHFHQLGTDGTRSKLLLLHSENSVTLCSCCCLIGDILVPTYSEALEPISSHWTRCDVKCVCKASKEDLILQFQAAADHRSHSESDCTGREARGPSGMNTSISWDHLSGQKYEYAPVLCNRPRIR